MAISLADPGEADRGAKETMATLRSATLPPSQEELLAAVALDVQAMTQHRSNPLGLQAARPSPGAGGAPGRE